MTTCNKIFMDNLLSFVGVQKHEWPGQNAQALTQNQSRREQEYRRAIKLI
jgi:hypothetical protein